MKIGNKELIIVGDRVLVKQEELQERTEVGLYLPQTVIEKEEVQGGRIMLTGPGMPLPQPHDVSTTSHGGAYPTTTEVPSDAGPGWRLCPFHEKSGDGDQVRR